MDEYPTGPEDATGGTDSENAVSITTAFELLARRPRRRLLYWFHRRNDRAVPFDALVRRLDAATDADFGGDDAAGIRVALHHVHLPKLDAAEVVDYDPDEGVVRYLGDRRLSALLEWGIREEVPE